MTLYQLSSNEKVTFSHFEVQPPCFHIIMFDGDPNIQLNENIDSILLDILPLLKKKLQGSRKIIFKEEAKVILENYMWPGNIRELLRFGEVISLNNSGVIRAKDILELTKGSSFKQEKPLVTDDHYDLIQRIGLREFLDMFSRAVIAKCLVENNNKVRKSITELQISSATFYRYHEREVSDSNMMIPHGEEYEHELQ